MDELYKIYDQSEGYGVDLEKQLTYASGMNEDLVILKVTDEVAKWPYVVMRPLNYAEIARLGIPHRVLAVLRAFEKE